MTRVIGDWKSPEYKAGLTDEELEEKYKRPPVNWGLPSVGGLPIGVGFGGESAEAWELCKEAILAQQAYMELGTGFERSVRGEHGYGFYLPHRRKYDDPTEI